MSRALTARELYEQLGKLVVLENRGDDEVLIREPSGIINWPKGVDHKGQHVRILTQ